MRVVSRIVWFGLMVLAFGKVSAQESPSVSQAPKASSPQPGQTQPAQVSVALPPSADFNAAIFEKPMPPEQLEFLKQFDGAPSGKLFSDKQFHKLMKNFVPDCEFHYGRDMPLDDALDMAMSGSKIPVRIRDGRYVLLSGTGGQYLGGRGFLWLDLQQGIGLGGFSFHPTNGEPTPSLVVFSRQVREKMMSYGALPQAFVMDMGEWSAQSRVPFILTNYFITGSNKRILLEHDEDYCSAADGAPAPGDCQNMNADAADLDMTAAYYLDQIHYATNGTAWSIGPDQQNFLMVRDQTCGGLGDPLGCRIRLTRERVNVIQGREPVRRR